MGRIAIFIDGAYLDFVLRDEFDGQKVDFRKLSRKIAGDKEILRTYYYHCEPYQSNPPTEEERRRFGNMQRFLFTLSNLPRHEVKLGKLEFRGIREDGKKIFLQKRVDILLGVDLVQLSAKGQISTAALVTGDSDFLPAVQAAKDDGVVVHLIHGKRDHTHSELWRACDERTQMDQAFINSVALTP